MPEMAEKGVRIRLKFLDDGILTKQQIDQGLAQCWHLVRFDEVRNIEEVASDISANFNLGESCPGGLGLEVDGFALPPTQPAQLLKDSDLVRVSRRKDTSIKPAEVPRGVRNDQHFIINGYRYASYGGLELRASDEFEKETGGYKSEEEEGEIQTDMSLDDGGRARASHNATPVFLELEKSIKKRTRVKDAGTDSGKKKRSSSNGLDLSLVNLEAKHEKFKKNKASRRGGVNLRAPDEFKRELGGYESEEDEDENEEETDFSLGGTKTLVPYEVRPSGTPKEEKRIGKKRKDYKMEDFDIARLGNNQMQHLKSAVNDVDEEAKEAPKKKKKKSSEFNISRPTEVSVEVDPVKGKGKKSSRRAKKGETLQNKDAKGDAQPESCRKMLSKGKVKSEMASGHKAGNDSWMDLEDSDNHEDRQRKEVVTAEGGATNFSTLVTDLKNTPAEEKKPSSRSARRKKAKRKWLRKQQEKAAEMSMEQKVVKLPPSCRGGGAEEPQPVVGIVEVETVEELQPVVVRTGHIRFEPYEEDSSGDPSRVSLPLLNLREQLKSKRQGQNWGQEKTAFKQKGRRQIEQSGYEEWPAIKSCRHENGENENRVYDVDLEKLPSLQGVPQEGDVIAYRLVELTSAWTPELSPYRVGVVVSMDKKIYGIKLAPHPDYPFRPTKEAELDDGLDQESESWPLPYDEDGFLETELSALVDLRLLEKKRGRISGQEDDAAGQNPEDEGSAKPQDGPSSISPVPESGEHTESSKANNTQVERKGEPVATEGNGQNPLQEIMITNASDHKAEEMEKTAASSMDWQTVLTKELQLKKLEIRQKSAQARGTESSGDPEKRASAKSRKSKYLRSAGVGSIVSLLREQQAL